MVVEHWKNVFSRGSYLLLAIVIAFLFYAFNVFLANWKSLRDFYYLDGFSQAFVLFGRFLATFRVTITWYSFTTLILISILVGMLASLIFYKARIIRGVSPDKKIGLFASLGIFLGALAPGCAVCGIGLISTLGLSATVISIFPFKGIELSFLSVVILLYATFKISNTSCKIMKNQMKGGKRRNYE